MRIALGDEDVHDQGKGLVIALKWSLKIICMMVFGKEKNKLKIKE